MKKNNIFIRDEKGEIIGDSNNAFYKIEDKQVVDFSDIRKKTLYKYATEMSKEEIIKELQILCDKKESKNLIFKFINAPTRLEFLTSIALVQNYNGLDVNPNYSVDDEGLPTFTASGGLADIECYDTDYDSYFEVTLMCGRSEQVNNEIIPISRHLREAKDTRRNESFSVFVAPVVHPDTKEAAEWQKMKNGVDIVTLNITEFLSALSTTDKPSNLLKMAI